MFRLNKYSLSLSIFLLITNSFLFAQTEEQITITTYYPSPYGSYRQSEVTDTNTTADRKAFTVSQSGAVVGTGYAIYATKTGASTTNVAGYFSASGATNNYGLIVANGSVGIGTTGPTALLHLNGAAATVTIEGNSNETTTTNNVLMLRSDVASADDAIFRVQANGATYADGAYTGTGADYAEWFEKEGELAPKDVVGLNLVTGRVRKYQAGDLLVGVYSQKPGFVGNQPLENTEEEMRQDYALVSLMGQVDVRDEQVRLENGKVYTQDGVQLGYRLANGRVLLRI